MQKPKMLIVGAGPRGKDLGPKTNAHFDRTTLDCDKTTHPDILGRVQSIPCTDASYDSVHAAHILEHVHGIEMAGVFEEIHRVLKPGGELFISVPNLDFVAEYILTGKLLESLYICQDGRPITAIDLLYGTSMSNELGLPNDTAYLHQYGFTRESLAGWLAQYDWELYVAYEFRCLGDYDRAELRGYAIKTGNEAAAPFSYWQKNINEDCGDNFCIRWQKRRELLERKF